MPVEILKLEDMEELIALIERKFDDRPSMVSMEEAEERFGRGCGLAYKVTRSVLDRERPLASNLMATAAEKLHNEHGTGAITSALILQAFAFYIEVEQGKDMKAFKEKFILCLDKAVESLGKGMRETHDTWTEQSTQKRSAKPPKTS